MGPALDVLLEYVVQDPDIIEPYISRLGAGIVPGTLQAMLYVICILA